MTKALLQIVFALTMAGQLLNSAAWAQVSVQFHPYDNTLETIAGHIDRAERTIDMALYNIDSKENNPVIAKIASDKIQERIKSGDLQIRMIFEGYASKEDNAKKMAELEELGIDVRHLASGKKMHHKFAVIDRGLAHPVVISGSANWSLSSRHNYHENIVFFEKREAMTESFHGEYELLWNASKEFGIAKEYEEARELGEVSEDGHFNSDNFQFRNGRWFKSGNKWTLTRKLAESFRNAENSIDIATTRVKLRPLYDEIKAAAERGVKVRIVVTMSEYDPSYQRRRRTMKDCEDVYQKKCSTSQNFAAFLHDLDHKNIEVRAKYYHLLSNNYIILTQQMHSKYAIVDGQDVLTGSFNWSYSAEYNHFENLIEISRTEEANVVEDFEMDFDRLWNLNREGYKSFHTQLLATVKDGSTMHCGFKAMTLEFGEIDKLFNAIYRNGRRLADLCQ